MITWNLHHEKICVTKSCRGVVKRLLIELLLIQNMFLLIIAPERQSREGLLGCYRYSGTIEKLRGYQSLPIPITEDVNECIEHCANHAYPFAGVIFRSMCHCTDETPEVEKPHPVEDCFGRCEDNPFYSCGGFQKISLLHRRYYSSGPYMDWGSECLKGQPSTSFRQWKAANERPCLRYEHYPTCLPKTDPEFQLSIKVPETFDPYFCVRHCKKHEFGYAAMQEHNRMCSCQKAIGKAPPCDATEEERNVFITYSHYHEDAGCHSVSHLPRDHAKRISNLTYLSDCAFYCVGHEYFGYSINATCGCEKYYLSTSDRLDELCDVTCDWSPVHICGGSNVVAVYHTGIKSANSELVLSPKFVAGYFTKEYGIISLSIAFFLFLLIMLWTNQRTKVLEALKLKVHRKVKMSRNLKSQRLNS